MKEFIGWLVTLAACFSALLLFMATVSVPVTLWLIYWDQPITYNQKIGLVVGSWCWLSLAVAWCWSRMKEGQL